MKNKHVEPGKQPELVKMLAGEAIAFLQKHDLVTVPPLAKDIWRLEMMAPERQKVNPFFLSGEIIQVSYPTDTMEHEDKLMSMRANNVHFSRATVHHELILGHHLQGFMTERHNQHRQMLSGHERCTAEGEVRRSFNGTYSPLYQVAYMIGGLQFRALHREMVRSRRCRTATSTTPCPSSARIPVEMVRAIMQKQPLSPEYQANVEVLPTAGLKPAATLNPDHSPARPLHFGGRR